MCIIYSSSIPTAYNASINQYGVDPGQYNQMNESMNNSTYSSDFQQSSYFPYSPMLSSMGGPLKPNYVGCMLKNTASNAIDPLTPAEETHNSSSEIVDLDTKEIKTVETDIDMTKNMSNLSKSDNETNKSLTTTSTTSSTTENPDGDSKTETENGNSSIVGSNVNPSEAVDGDQRRSCDKIVYDWATKLMKKYEPGLMINSPKMVIFFCILNESIRIGDRVLLFSQSLLTLNLIEKFLHLNQVPGDEGNSCWTYNKHYFRRFMKISFSNLYFY